MVCGCVFCFVLLREDGNGVACAFCALSLSLSFYVSVAWPS